MATIRPFQGWRYAPHHDLTALLAPPYDVISPGERQSFAARHPQNVVHLILPQADVAADLDPYQHAARIFQSWSKQGVLLQDPSPACYLLRQTFRLPGGVTAVRRGFAAQLLLAPWGQGILPHERTFPQAKADRLALLRATGLQDSPIFTLFRDPKAEVTARIASVQESAPDATFRDDQGDLHELWSVVEPDLIADLAEAMTTHVLYVADGHHRYETSLAYQSWRRHQEDNPAVGRPYDYCLAYFASMDDPGTVILPAHRLVTHGRRSDSGHLVASLGADFDVLPFADDEALITTLASRPAGEATFGLIVENGAPYLLCLRSSDHQRALLQAEYGAVVAGLPVAVLQAMVLGPCFGISSDPQTQKAQLQFEPDAGVAAAHVRAGRAQAALLTTPISMAQLAAVADSGAVAPPKATYFYPKLPAGLVFNQVETRPPA